MLVYIKSKEKAQNDELLNGLKSLLSRLSWLQFVVIDEFSVLIDTVWI